MYLDHRTVDSKSNIIVDCFVTKGNVHDSVPLIGRVEYLKSTFKFNIKEFALDSGYDTLDIKRYFRDNNIFGVIGYRRYGQSNTEIRKWQFKYKEKSDCYVCPETGVILPYKRIDRQGYKLYYDKDNCKGCPELKKCTKDKYRTIRRHIREDINEWHRINRLSERGKELYKLRKEMIERSFADSKQNHGYRYAMHRGLKKNQHYTWLICAAQNMKNIALKRERARKMGK